MSALPDKIFEIKTEAIFEKLALEVFRLQHETCSVYRQFCEVLKINPAEIKSLHQIPFLPIEFFKTHEVRSLTPNPSPRERGTECYKIFSSSGTTGIQSKHYVSDISIYEQSFRKGFEHFYRNIEDYCLLVLLPSYLEREGSSLVYMADDLIKRTKNPDSGFYLHNLNELSEKLKMLLEKNQKVILLGVTYALLDLASPLTPLQKEKGMVSDLIVMETGGMKGKRKELLREELHQILCEKFGVNVIHSEYGMTELLSQAYSKGNGIFQCPPLMKVLIRDVNDPLKILETGKSGGINVIDLANINSCSFIATQDLGILHNNGSFEVSGRFDNSDLRGCNLLVQ